MSSAPARPNGVGLLRRLLQQAAEAERTLEMQLRDFAEAASDDVEVQTVFLAHADETAHQQQRIVSRIGELGGDVNEPNSEAAGSVNASPQIAQASGVPEERLLENIIVAYTAEAGEIALYEQIAQLAGNLGDSASADLARSIQGQEQNAAEKLWHFLPSRSKIAFNMLTVSELDPAVETKLADDRIES